ncbi:MAG: hypothetical protein M0024_13750 [Nitrospiraceae bacterium]|nr:hypothetical protein [Nitrospiraceae bacterium]
MSVSADTLRKCVLHWSLLADIRAEWKTPPGTVWPEGSVSFGQSAVQTPFVEHQGVGRISLAVDLSAGYRFLVFVLFFPEDGHWDNNNGGNYYIELSDRKREELTGAGISTDIAGVAKTIIERETGRNSWTLMHRFNLCFDLLDEVRGDRREGFALIFVWLRFSAIRQLDWQRNYNTKPRELSHALDRLTLKLANLYAQAAGERQLIRLMMTTLGRGGEGQRVRDEVLEIMHRHHIKEVTGHFMEEWHQKLHNNTTPDDVVICEAFLEFQRSNGNLDRFYKRLEEGGVSKKRLEGYERPIRSHPDFIPYLKDALIHDFEKFLGVLKSVHAGTDLGIAIHEARRLFDPEMHGLMDFVWFHRDDRTVPVSSLAEKITEARRRLAGQMHGHDDRVRDLLFLDLAMEDFLRVAVERNLDSGLTGNQVVDLLDMALENLCFTSTDDELIQCLSLWRRLVKMPRFEREWSLMAKAFADRLERALASWIDRYYRLIQPKAEFLGNAFRAEKWAIDLFAEEVVRGRIAFAVSMLLRRLDPLLRKSAQLGNWQVISRGGAAGSVEVVPSLRSVQSGHFDRPSIIIADSVSGDEEIPPGVVAVITPAVIDILAHLSVRSRNAGVVFATCYDQGIIDRMKSLRGKSIRLGVNPAGEIVLEEGAEEPLSETAPHMKAGKLPSISIPVFRVYAVTSGDFDEKIVGGKALNLKRLRQTLPEWVRIPSSAALTFGVFEKVLSDGRNRETADAYHALIEQIKDSGDPGDILRKLRESVLNLKSTEGIVSSLRPVMEQSGLGWPDWDAAWTCIKRVWASKWNDRAFLSRRANGIAHEDLFMAVLIQRVIEAEYSFVIHTVNPMTGKRDDAYAEVVLGLGEALVGNYPGRAMSFSCRKGDGKSTVLSFPSKDKGLFGGGLIFRSDSNGEDLSGFAGAGLYDSFIMPQPLKAMTDYTNDRLVWDRRFRDEFMRKICSIAEEAEKAMGYPQDIEGAYSGGAYHVVQTRPQVGLEGG